MAQQIIIYDQRNQSKRKMSDDNSSIWLNILWLEIQENDYWIKISPLRDWKI